MFVSKTIPIFVSLVGLRDKKDVSSLMSDEKRAPNSGFFGMRGKKAPLVNTQLIFCDFAGLIPKKIIFSQQSTGFFGTRGKKGPFEFRGKFVGVRGKKIPDGSLRRLAMELGELQPEMQSSVLMGAESNKRAPSGFQGVRGKKWTGKFNTTQEK